MAVSTVRKIESGAVIEPGYFTVLAPGARQYCSKRLREICIERQRQAEAEAAARTALREQQGAQARQRRLDELAKDPESAWAEIRTLIDTRVPARYDEAVALLVDLRNSPRAMVGPVSSVCAWLPRRRSTCANPP
ncbi:MAG TPA: hypothetical protein VFQ44_06500 [Streptosporangiaceae bacterium]|nr:hypothetical protein [Streptosporangiaceae bacterium]